MKKLLIVAAAGCVAAIALAAVTVIGAKGQGGALNAIGQRAEFNIDAKKSRDGDGHVIVGGFAKFISFAGTNTNPISHGITVPLVRTLAKSGNVCQFAGPASMVVREGAHVVTVHGVCTFNVTDRRSPLHPGDPDLIRVRFVQATTNHVYEWGGAVNRGDIEVYERVIN